MVEVGYGVDPAVPPARLRPGDAAAPARAGAGAPVVHTFRATVSPDNVASLGLIAQLPFEEVGEQWDEEDGLEIIFELPV